MAVLTDEGSTVLRLGPHRTVTDDLIPRAEVARQFDVCQRTLRIWERRGRGPPTIRVGKRVYYRAEAVRRWLLDPETKATTT